MMGEMKHEDLVIAAMPDAKRIALAFAHRQASGRIDGDELIAIAYSALVEAAKRYDGSRPFKNFARYRVRGAILDALRNWSQLDTTRGQHTTVLQIEREDGTFVADRFVVFDTTRDMRALARAVESLGDDDAAKIRRYATADSGKGNEHSEKFYLDFGMSRFQWWNYRKGLLAKLRFVLNSRGITKVSDCL